MTQSFAPGCAGPAHVRGRRGIFALDLLRPAYNLSPVRAAVGQQHSCPGPTPHDAPAAQWIEHLNTAQKVGSSRLPGRAIFQGLSGNAGSEEHTAELQSLMRLPYAVLCLTTKINIHHN